MRPSSPDPERGTPVEGVEGPVEGRVGPPVDPVVDPVVEKRARIARAAKTAQRVGYAFLLLAMVVFVIGITTGFPTWTVDVTVASLVVAIVVLPVPIVVGYGVRAAEREERGGGRFH